MAEVADLVYFSCLGESGPIPVTGWIVDLIADDVVVGTALLKGVANIAKGKSGTVEVSFVRVRNSAASLELPEGWTGPKAGLIPSLHTCQMAWKQAKESDLASSETEPPGTRRPKGISRKGLSSDMSNLKNLFGEGVDVADDTEDDDEDLPKPRGQSSHLPPGGSKPLHARSKKGGVNEDKDDFDIKKLLVAGLSSGQSPSEMMPMVLLGLLMDRDSKKKKKKDRASSSQDDLGLLGGSGSDSSDAEGEKGRGMKAVATLNRLHRQVQDRPHRICELFEKEAREELGVVPGQSWTLRDYIKRQQWGKFKGIYRCAVMDVAAYEYLRAGQHESAAAQLVQNLKAKMQSVLQGGDWASAWLLTGLQDPLARREFAGTREEMAIVSGYVDALHKLQKRVREAKGQGSGGHEEDEEGHGGAAGAASKK
eukprot:s3981_g5.t1